MFPKPLAAAFLFCAIALPATAGAASPQGRWLAEDINGGGVIDRLQTTLELGADGKVTGMGGCNRYMGSATVTDNAISFQPMASTRKACSPAVMDQENKFHAALTTVTSWRIEQTKLLLLDKDGIELMRLSKQD